MTGERQETGPWTTKTQHRDGTLINNILITFVPALSGTTIIYWEPAAHRLLAGERGAGCNAIIYILIYMPVPVLCYCWTGEEAAGWKLELPSQPRLKQTFLKY